MWKEANSVFILWHNFTKVIPCIKIPLQLIRRAVYMYTLCPPISVIMPALSLSSSSLS